MLEAFYGLLSTLDQLPKAQEKQIAFCQQALEIFPFDAQLLCAMGSYLERQGRIDLACRSFEAAARFGQVDPQTTHLIEIADIATVCQATCHRLLGDVDSGAALWNPPSMPNRNQNGFAVSCSIFTSIATAAARRLIWWLNCRMLKIKRAVQRSAGCLPGRKAKLDPCFSLPADCLGIGLPRHDLFSRPRDCVSCYERPRIGGADNFRLGVPPPRQSRSRSICTTSTAVAECNQRPCRPARSS